MPEPGTRLNIPAIKNTVLGIFRTADSILAASVKTRAAQREEAAAPKLQFMQRRYTAQPSPPLMAQYRYSDFGI